MFLLLLDRWGPRGKSKSYTLDTRKLSKSKLRALPATVIRSLKQGSHTTFPMMQTARVEYAMPLPTVEVSGQRVGRGRRYYRAKTVWCSYHIVLRFWR